MPKLISCQNLHHRIGGQQILANVSLTIDSGDFLIIIGPNGAGKSQLMQYLAQLQHPRSGSITFKPRLRFSYVPQRFVVDATLPITSADFIKLNQRHKQSELDEIYCTLNISHLANRPLHLLSGGELQSVLLARAIARKPEVLLLDEPAQNLDVCGQLQIYQLLLKLRQVNHELAIAMVAHDLHLVFSWAQQIVCLNQRIRCRGSSRVVAEHPEFQQLFGQEIATSCQQIVSNHAKPDQLVQLAS